MDKKNELDYKSSLAPALRTTTVTGSGVDLQGFDSAVVVIHPGAITDGTHTPTVVESDNNSDFTAVSASDLIGSLAAIAANTIQRVGYKGTKRYIAVLSTITGSPSTGGLYSAGVIRGDARVQPVS